VANENLDEVVIQVAEKLGFQITADDISIAHRLTAKRGKTPGIIVICNCINSLGHSVL